MNILVVEDDPVSARVVVRVAERLGHAPTVYVDAAEAWSRFTAQDDVDVIISAWQPQGMPGEELCRRVRGAPGRYRPFLFLTAASERTLQRQGMLAGADDYLVKPLDPHDFELRLIRVARLSDLHRTLEAQAAELRKLNQRFRQEGVTDALTGVGNRKRFDEDLATTHGRAESLGLGYAVAMFDADWFKPYNDREGHPAGDRVLKRVADALRGCCRDSDRVYRYGGEEFAAILQTDAPDVASRICERMRAAVEAEGMPHPTAPGGRVTLSGGLVTVPGTTLWRPAEVVERADIALYAAKEEGRNRVRVWDPGMARRAP